jgi:hypothetical protein
MAHLTLSDKYGIAAALGLLLLVLFDSAILMLVVSVVGILAGLWVLRGGETRRVAYVALLAFAVAAMFGVYGLIRSG